MASSTENGLHFKASGTSSCNCLRRRTWCLCTTEFNENTVTWTPIVLHCRLPHYIALNLLFFKSGTLCFIFLLTQYLSHCLNAAILQKPFSESSYIISYPTFSDLFNPCCLNSFPMCFVIHDKSSRLNRPGVNSPMYISSKQALCIFINKRHFYKSHEII